MSQKNKVKKFKAIFIKIHVISITWSIITAATTGLLPALAIYLILIFFLTGNIYFLNLDHLTFREIRGKLHENQKVNGKIFRTMKKSRQATK